MGEDEDGYDANGKLTPRGLANWMDWEGGLTGLYYHSGTEPYIEAGCNPDIVNAFEKALNEMEGELTRIGATL